MLITASTRIVDQDIEYNFDFSTLPQEYIDEIFDEIIDRVSDECIDVAINNSSPIIHGMIRNNNYFIKHSLAVKIGMFIDTELDDKEVKEIYNFILKKYPTIGE